MKLKSLESSCEGKSVLLMQAELQEGREINSKK